MFCDLGSQANKSYSKVQSLWRLVELSLSSNLGRLPCHVCSTTGCHRVVMERKVRVGGRRAEISEFCLKGGQVEPQKEQTSFTELLQWVRLYTECFRCRISFLLPLNRSWEHHPLPFNFSVKEKSKYQKKLYNCSQKQIPRITNTWEPLTAY